MGVNRCSVGVSAGEASPHQLPQGPAQTAPSAWGHNELLPESLILLFKEFQQLDPVFIICLCLHSFLFCGTLPEFWDGLQCLHEDPDD